MTTITTMHSGLNGTYPELKSRFGLGTRTRVRGHPPVLGPPRIPRHPSSTAHQSVLAPEGHAFAHASLFPMGRPASTPMGPPLRALCLAVALEHVNEISHISLKTYSGPQWPNPRWTPVAQALHISLSPYIFYYCARKELRLRD